MFVSEKTGFEYEDVKNVIECTFEVISERWKNGNIFNIENFGRFSFKRANKNKDDTKSFFHSLNNHLMYGDILQRDDKNCKNVSRLRFFPDGKLQEYWIKSKFENKK